MATAQREQATSSDTVDRSALDSVVRATQEQMLQRPELLQMRMENEVIMAECRVRPRNLAEIRRMLTEQLDAFPELAEDAIYSKPVGSEDGSNKQKFARGLSIRAAEVLAEAYGYNRVRSDVTPLDAEATKVKVEATFTDFQGGRIWQDGGIVSAYYKAKGGGMRRIPEDRFFNVICKSEASKRVREVILRSVNAALKAWFFAECDRRMDALLDDTKVNQIVGGYARLGVTVEQLEALLGRPRSMGWTNQDRSTLASLWNAIKDGETTVAEAFPKQEEAKKPEGPVNGSALTSAAVSEPPPREQPKNLPTPPTPAPDAHAEQKQAFDSTKVRNAFSGRQTLKEVTDLEMSLSSDDLANADRYRSLANERRAEIRAKVGKKDQSEG